ncbi:hypothetical protein QPK29_025355 [Massilia sp. YIM B02787]|uniref:Uncharacterized protein n=2 Tax=Massilia orientalis TaxID=3050128 RepID=A0ACC7MMK7_9BURK|nr:hypothetical protein [Massilia sp. YIM B02787]
MLKICVGVFVVLGIVGCSGKPPVSMTLKSSDYGVPYVTITALDEVTVKDIRFNRGANCKINSDRSLPAKISFGNRFDVVIACPDKVIEAEIATDKGDYTFTF